MGQKEKLIERLKSRPRDMTFEEIEALLGLLGYQRSNKGRTSGSRIEFKCEGRAPILFHRPHSRKELLTYEVKLVLTKLEEEGLI